MIVTNKIVEYLGSTLFEEFFHVEEHIRQIYAELIEAGYLPDELANEEFVVNLLMGAYESFPMFGEEIDDLVDAINELALGDREETEDQGTEIKYVLFKYTLDLAKGTKERYLIKHTFNDTDEITGFLEDRLFNTYLDTLSADNIVLAHSDLLFREDLVNTLLGSHNPYSETIADNLIQDCLGGWVLIKHDIDEDKPVSAEVYNVIEVSSYND